MGYLSIPGPLRGTTKEPSQTSEILENSDSMRPPGVGERVHIIDPEQPPLHQKLGNEVSRVLDNVGDKNDSHTEEPRVWR